MRKFLEVGILIIAVFAMATSALAAPPPKRVLVLYDEDKDSLPGLSRTDRSLRETLKSSLGERVDIHSESMALSRADGADYESLAADFYRRKYAASPPDLIIAVMDAALGFMERHGATMFPGVPIVFASIDASSASGKALPANVTGVRVKRSYAPTLELVLKVQPRTRHVFVIGGAASFDRFLQGLVRRDLQAYEGRVDIEYLFGGTMSDYLARIAHLPADSAILYVSMLRDGSGRGFVPAAAMSSIAAAANAPLYVFLDQYVGQGAVGGSVHSFQAHAKQVAELGLKILDGASPASLPPHDESARVDMFDARQLRRWHIDAALLPPGSVVLNAEPSLWSLYRWYIVAAVALVILQGALIAGLLVARKRQRHAEAEARKERDELAHVLRVATLGELTSSLTHEISQPLSAILFNAEALRRALGAHAADGKYLDEAVADIHESAARATQVLEQLRSMFRKQRADPVAVDLQRLIRDVVRLLHSAMLIERIEIREVFADGVPPVFGDPVHLQQVLMNVMRNASDAVASAEDGPRIVTIATRRSRPGHVMVEVADTGPGFAGGDLERIFQPFFGTKESGLGMGLAICRSMVEAYGGLIWATRNAGRGLTIHLELVAFEKDKIANSHPETQDETMSTGRRE